VAKPKKSPPPPSSNRLYLILGAVALVVVVGAIFLTRGGSSGATAPVDIALDPSELQRARGIPMGTDNAPVELHEFADFQCPACAQFSTFVHPLIKERLVDTGVLRLVRYDFPLINNHPHAFLAARAGRCADEGGRFWEFHDVVYGRQPTWSIQRDPSAEFVSYAGLVGLNADAFEECLDSDRHAEEVTRNLRLGESLGVNGTPSFMLNGQRASFQDYNQLEQRVYEMAGRTPPSAATAPEM
jgi:protein-disulfide isomerase